RQLLRDVQTGGRDEVAVLTGPRNDALHEQAVGTPDVEKRSVRLDRRHNHAAEALPVTFVAPEAGLLPGAGPGEVLRFVEPLRLAEKPLPGPGEAELPPSAPTLPRPSPSRKGLASGAREIAQHPPFTPGQPGSRRATLPSAPPGWQSADWATADRTRRGF